MQQLIDDGIKAHLILIGEGMRCGIAEKCKLRKSTVEVVAIIIWKTMECILERQYLILICS